MQQNELLSLRDVLYARQMLVKSMSQKENTQNAETRKYILNLNALVALLVVFGSLLFCCFAV